MTTTPRTDAEHEKRMHDYDCLIGTVPADFARELERENAKLLDENVEANGRLDMQMKREAKLKALLSRAKELLPPGKWRDGAPFDDAAKLREDIADA